ncbi:MAG: DUF4405 domain-containing protein [Planctomycetota bacterium]
MKRSTINFTVDLVSFLTLFGMVTTGAILRWVLPPGSGGLGRELHDGRGREQIRELLGMGRYDWGDVHLWLGIIFIVLMLVHLVLHWSWITCYVRSLFSVSEKQPCEENPTS